MFRTELRVLRQRPQFATVSQGEIAAGDQSPSEQLEMAANFQGKFESQRLFAWKVRWLATTISPTVGQLLRVVAGILLVVLYAILRWLPFSPPLSAPLQAGVVLLYAAAVFLFCFYFAPRDTAPTTEEATGLTREIENSGVSNSAKSQTTSQAASQAAASQAATRGSPVAIPLQLGYAGSTVEGKTAGPLLLAPPQGWATAPGSLHRPLWD
jgi:uncharacterized membrane protein YedE/YeeE